MKENKVGSTVVSRFDYTTNGMQRRSAVSTSGTAFTSASEIGWTYDSLGQVPEGSIVIVREHQDKGFPKKGTIVIYSDANGSTLKEFGYRKASSDDDPESPSSAKPSASLSVAIAESYSPPARLQEKGHECNIDAR